MPESHSDMDDGWCWYLVCIIRCVSVLCITLFNHKNSCFSWIIHFLSCLESCIFLGFWIFLHHVVYSIGWWMMLIPLLNHNMSQCFLYHFICVPSLNHTFSCFSWNMHFLAFIKTSSFLFSWMIHLLLFAIVLHHVVFSIGWRMMLLPGLNYEMGEWFLYHFICVPRFNHTFSRFCCFSRNIYLCAFLNSIASSCVIHRMMDDVNTWFEWWVSVFLCHFIYIPKLNPTFYWFAWIIYYLSFLKS